MSKISKYVISTSHRNVHSWPLTDTMIIQLACFVRRHHSHTLYTVVPAGIEASGVSKETRYVCAKLLTCRVWRRSDSLKREVSAGADLAYYTSCHESRVSLLVKQYQISTAVSSRNYSVDRQRPASWEQRPTTTTTSAHSTVDTEGSIRESHTDCLLGKHN